MSETYEEVSSRASAVRTRYAETPATTADYAVFEGEAERLGVMLSEIQEALKPLLIAGVAFPTADLPAELSRLSERAAVHGLATAVEGLGHLSLSLQRVISVQSRRERTTWIKRSWSDLQGLITWLRVMRSEYDLLQVEGNLAASYEGRVRQVEQSGETMSVEVWPYGVTMERIGESDNWSLVVHGRAMGLKRSVRLLDTFQDVDPNDPFGVPGISRLMQNKQSLKTLLGGTIRFEEHPTQRVGEALIFEPGFKSIPTLIPRSESSGTPPGCRLSELMLDRQGRVVWSESGKLASARAVGWMTVDVVMGVGGPIMIEAEGGGALPMQPGAVLKRSLLKLLARHSGTVCRLRGVFLVTTELMTLLNVTTDFEGRVYPAQDPSLFLIPREVISQQFMARADKAQTTMMSLLLNVLACQFGAVSASQRKGLERELVQYKPVGLEAGWLKVLLCQSLDMPWATDRLQGLVYDALSAATIQDIEDVPDDHFERVMGHFKGGQSGWARLFPTTSRSRAKPKPKAGGLSARVLYRALWLAAQIPVMRNGVKTRQLCAAILERHHKGPLRKPTVAAFCSRALLIHMTEIDGPNARTLLEAHLKDLSGEGKWKKPGDPSPKFMELLHLSHTHALLSGRPVWSELMLSLSDPFVSLRCGEVLVSYLLAPAAGVGAADHAKVFEALLLMKLAGLTQHYIE